MDVRLPGIDGISAIGLFKSLDADLPIITITAFGELSTAIDAIQKGAFEYIVKPFDLQKVQTTMLQAVATKKLSDALPKKQTDNEPSRHDSQQPPRLVGSSALMQEVFKQIALTTTSDAPVLITGERGTGKGLTARLIHEFGRQNQGRFITVNTTAVGNEKIETTLFGSADEPGAMAQASGGTLLIDDVAELPLETQIKLLQVLESSELPTDLPDTKTHFRLITATHQDLLSQINHGDFRHDLFYRLRTFEIKLPPLRLRLEDIPELVNYFIQRSTHSNVSVTKDFTDQLKTMPWPDNVRELQSVVESAVTQARGGVVSSQHIASAVSRIAARDNPGTDARIKKLLADWTHDHWNDSPEIPLYEALIALVDSAILPQAFLLSENQYSAAARRLGIHRTTLKKKLDDIDNPGGE